MKPISKSAILFAAVASVIVACGSSGRQATEAATTTPAPTSSASTTMADGPATPQPNDPSVAAHLLAVADLPAGWTASMATNTGSSAPSCLSQAPDPTTGQPQARIVLANQSAFVAVEEQAVQLASGGGTAAYEQLTQTLQGCSNLTISVKGQQLPATIAPAEVTTVGDATSAFTMTVSSANQTASLQIALIRVGDTVVMLIYSQSGTPGQPSQLPAVLSAAAAKAGNGSTT